MADVEDGECSNSPREDVVVIEDEDESSFVIDRNDDALDVVVEENGEANGTDAKRRRTTGDWMTDITSNVLTLKEDEPEKKKEKKKQRFSCWNCDGDHNLNNCPEERDHNKIRERRSEFQERSMNKESRYHDPADGAVTFKPGRISDKLQRALGIGPNDIPEWIYRMRKMGFINGYPPGYLKTALCKQVNSDDLLSFHSDHPDLKKEERDERPRSPTVNGGKVIYYFGFNKTYRALRDREHFTVPPFDQFVQRLEEGVKKKFHEEERRKKSADRKRKANGDEETTPAKRRKSGKAEEQPEQTENGDAEESAREEIKADDVPVETASPSISLTKRVSLGTPVLHRKSGGAVSKPSLEAFAQGIVPFHVDPPTERTGFMKKIMQAIKEKLG